VTEPLIIIVSGPGGAGKGTIVEELVRRDDNLWLSRSWTTRTQREGESDDAYVFVSRTVFENRIADGGFLEWTEFLGNLYGSPTPNIEDGLDIVLEIELHGASQVKQRHPDAILVFVQPPSRDEQRRRLQGRGDSEDHVIERLRKADEEERRGAEIADVVVVNDDLARCVAEIEGIIGAARQRRR
jgi:guanylate kinase